MSTSYSITLSGPEIEIIRDCIGAAIASGAFADRATLANLNMRLAADRARQQRAAAVARQDAMDGTAGDATAGEAPAGRWDWFGGSEA